MLVGVKYVQSMHEALSVRQKTPTNIQMIMKSIVK